MGQGCGESEWGVERERLVTAADPLPALVRGCKGLCFEFVHCVLAHRESSWATRFTGAFAQVSKVSALVHLLRPR
jgi:hypothetical protein